MLGGTPISEIMDYRIVLPRMAAPQSMTVQMPTRAVLGMRETGNYPTLSGARAGEAGDQPRRPTRVRLRSMFDALIGEELRDLVSMADTQLRNGNLASAAHFLRRAHRLTRQTQEPGEESIFPGPMDFEEEESAGSASFDPFTSPEGLVTSAHVRRQISAPVDMEEFGGDAKLFLFRTAAAAGETRLPEEGLRLSVYA